MIIKFDKPYLEELYYNGKCSDKKHRFQPSVITKYIKRVVTLAEAGNIEMLYPLNSLNYEVLSGDKNGMSSVRIDDQYRLEFTVSTKEGEETVLNICTLIDITNHYKK